MTISEGTAKNLYTGERILFHLGRIRDTLDKMSEAAKKQSAKIESKLQQQGVEQLPQTEDN